MIEDKMDSKTEYKYKVEVSQSLTSGIIALHATYKFDEVDDLPNSRNIMIAELLATEKSLKDLGYKVAKDIEVKDKNTNNGTKVGNYTTAKKVEPSK